MRRGKRPNAPFSAAVTPPHPRRASFCCPTATKINPTAMGGSEMMFHPRAGARSFFYELGFVVMSPEPVTVPAAASLAP